MPRKIISSIGFRIAILFSLSSIVISGLMGLMVHRLVIQHFESQDRMQLEGKVQLINNLFTQNPLNTTTLQLDLKDALVGHHNLIFQIERPQGHIIFSSAIQPIYPMQSKNDPTSWVEWQFDNKTYRGLISHQAPAAQHTPSVRIIIGMDKSEHQHFLDHFKQQLLLIGGLGTLILMALGWFAIWRGLFPLQQMTHIAERISAQHLSERLPTQHIPTELYALTTAFNAMLDRLEFALEKLSDFSSDLAHEMRTPINNLMTQTQVCLSRPRELQVYQDILYSNLEEFERIARMVSDMLFLAKAEHGLSLNQAKSVDLNHEISALLDFYDALAAEKHMQFIHTGQALHIQGDAAMLRRALSNLISNAIKYGISHSNITIHTKINAEHQPQLLMTNQSPELTSSQLSRLFDRFYRTDASRQRTVEGTGLGLAITQSILQAHEAHIDATFQHDALTFTITFKHSSQN